MAVDPVGRKLETVHFLVEESCRTYQDPADSLPEPVVLGGAIGELVAPGVLGELGAVGELPGDVCANAG
ncbi:MAG: hypothetical protein ACTHLY_09705 [Pseudolabrys sp.]